jgi:hypothetical protein
VVAAGASREGEKEEEVKMRVVYIGRYNQDTFYEPSCSGVSEKTYGRGEGV